MAATALLASCGRGDEAAASRPPGSTLTWAHGTGELQPVAEPTGLALIYTGALIPKVDWLLSALQAGGLSTLRIKPAAGGAASSPSGDDQEQPEPIGVLSDALAYARSDAAVPAGLVALGADASNAWPAIAAGSGLSGAVMVDVPGVANLDFARGRNVATLALQAVSDQAVVSTHTRTHTALAVVGVPHEMVQYGKVGPAFFDAAGPDWAEPTAEDAARRSITWLRTAFTAGMRVQPPASNRGSRPPS